MKGGWGERGGVGEAKSGGGERICCGRGGIVGGESAHDLAGVKVVGVDVVEGEEVGHDGNVGDYRAAADDGTKARDGAASRSAFEA